MSEKEVIVKLKTITPLWTGDAWQESSQLRPSSLFGSLRFWFSVYWKFIKNGSIEDLNHDEEATDSSRISPLIKQIVLKYIFDHGNVEDMDSLIDKALEEIEISVPSRLFGCTGWKSRVDIEIKSSKPKKHSKDGIEFKFPKGQINSEGWLNRVLFQDGSAINVYEDVELVVKTTEYWWNKYLADFFEFFKDKIILVGGKLSLGFGMVNIRLVGDSASDDDTEMPEENTIGNIMMTRKITGINYGEGKKILGFNFKYYLRKREDRHFRKKNFGDLGKASNVYVSHLLEGDRNSVYLICLNLDGSRIPINVVDKYVNSLRELNEGRGGNNA
ncbi:type III-B CRISPR module RAMP protein Cmr1 [Caldicoprobacter faecalis]|uniref:CRISPR-associated protein Cmr1 n=1 Tax=Caldicoprobacter faecalis TaxID=937334 RepID=A0A1I5WHW8_9FIRM|nr:type III-B CRISPR module RAMP protein Cmr1 [Caldicoprobacter faecalis]SFQ19231.1 CRISPR-associated protein Cmr1 [Caldicoprobacter faecalis]